MGMLISVYKMNMLADCALYQSVRAVAGITVNINITIDTDYVAVDGTLVVIPCDSVVLCSITRLYPPCSIVYLLYCIYRQLHAGVMSFSDSTYSSEVCPFSSLTTRSKPLSQASFIKTCIHLSTRVLVVPFRYMYLRR